MKFRLTLKPVGLPALVQMIAPNRWCYLGYSFGAWLDECDDGVYSLLMLNGAIGRGQVGGIYYEYIRIEVIPEGAGAGWLEPRGVDLMDRVGHEADTDWSITIAPPEGDGYFVGEGIKILRFTVNANAERMFDGEPVTNAHRFLALPRALSEPCKLEFNQRATRILNVLATGIPDIGVAMHRSCGDWMPYDSPGPGDGGGWRICPLPGYTNSKKHALVIGDLTAERMRMRVDAWTGLPVFAEEPWYEATRGWGKITTREDMVVPVDPSDIYNDGRRPKNVNSGQCEYEGALVGFLAHYPDGKPYFSPGYQPFDRAHLIRGVAPFVENWYRWGDKASQRVLRGIAADAWAGVHFEEGTPSATSRKYGREWAWPAYSLLVAGETERARKMMAHANKAQMPNKSWYRALSSKRSSYGFNPDPWEKYNADPWNDMMQTMEAGYMAFVNIQAGFAEEGEMFLHAIYNDAEGSFRTSEGYVGKWYAVAHLGHVLDRLRSPCGPDESVMLWPAVAVAARLDAKWPRSWLRAAQRLFGSRPVKWVDLMPKMHRPGRLTPCGDDIVGALFGEPLYWEQSVGAMEIVERSR